MVQAHLSLQRTRTESQFKSVDLGSSTAAADDEEDIACFMLLILKDQSFVDFSLEHELSSNELGYHRTCFS